MRGARFCFSVITTPVRSNVLALAEARCSCKNSGCGQEVAISVTYLTEMATSCPHPLFLQEHRASASASTFDLTGVVITEKQNLAPRIAGLILQTVTHNTRRHDTL